MFLDQSSDGVFIFFLQFLEDLENPRKYNWGAAVLAVLYRELSRACLSDARSIAGPVGLLQIWCWTRFTIGRPIRSSKVNEPEIGGDIFDERPPYGIIWTTRHEWRDNPGHSGTDHYRDQFERLATVRFVSDCSAT